MFSLMDERAPFYVDDWKPAPFQPPNVRMEVGLVSYTVPSLPSVHPCSLALSHQLHNLNPLHPTVISPLPCSSQPSSLCTPAPILVGHPQCGAPSPCHGLILPRDFLSAPFQSLSPRITCTPVEVFSHQSLKFRHIHIQYNCLCFKLSY